MTGYVYVFIFCICLLFLLSCVLSCVLQAKLCQKKAALQREEDSHAEALTSIDRLYEDSGDFLVGITKVLDEGLHHVGFPESLAELGHMKGSAQMRTEVTDHVVAWLSQEYKGAVSEGIKQSRECQQKLRGEIAYLDSSIEGYSSRAAWITIQTFLATVLGIRPEGLESLMSGTVEEKEESHCLLFTAGQRIARTGDATFLADDVDSWGGSQQKLQQLRIAAPPGVPHLPIADVAVAAASAAAAAATSDPPEGEGSLELSSFVHLPPSADHYVIDSEMGAGETEYAHDFAAGFSSFNDYGNRESFLKERMRNSVRKILESHCPIIMNNAGRVTTEKLGLNGGAPLWLLNALPVEIANKAAVGKPHRQILFWKEGDLGEVMPSEEELDDDSDTLVWQGVL
jgi:hypothetical protein